MTLKPGEPSRELWLRGLHMLLFAFVFGLAEVLLWGVALFRLVVRLLGQEEDARVGAFGSSLSRYVYQIASYLSFSSERKPFPFAPWPNPEGPDPYS
jgi:hypothetical protein